MTYEELLRTCAVRRVICSGCGLYRRKGYSCTHCVVRRRQAAQDVVSRFR